MRILLSNDDGFYAPGLHALETIAKTISDDIWIVAPSHEQSGAAHSLTLNRPLKMRKVSDKKYMVEGTPTDCVLMAVKEIMGDMKPDLVLSGINAGSNMADDVTYSGTIAAAMEATLLGIPAIALSQTVNLESIKWRTPLAHGPDIIKKLLATGWAQNVFMNVNFPDVEPDAIKGIAITSQGARPDYRSLIKSSDPRGNPYYWIGSVPEHIDENEKTDLAALNRNQISISPLHLDLTHFDSLKTLEQIFEMKNE